MDSDTTGAGDNSGFDSPNSASDEDPAATPAPAAAVECDLDDALRLRCRGLRPPRRRDLVVVAVLVG